jgi:hypothetical protein
MVGARRLARPRLPGSKPGGSAIPREPRAGKNGVPDPPTPRSYGGQAGSVLRLLRDPEMPFCKGVTGAAFQILFEMLSLRHRLERDV